MTTLIERSIQDVVSTYRKVNNLPKRFFSNISMTLSSVLLGLNSVLLIASEKLRSPQMTIGLFLEILLRGDWKFSIVYLYELDMSGF